jgi:plasmid stability protein
LRVQAAEHSHSTEEEAREFRREAVSGASAPKNVGRAIHTRFGYRRRGTGASCTRPNARIADILVSDAVTALDANTVSEAKRPKSASGGFDPSA